MLAMFPLMAFNRVRCATNAEVLMSSADNIDQVPLSVLRDGCAQHSELVSHGRNSDVVHTLVLRDFGNLTFQADIAAIMKHDGLHSITRSHATSSRVAGGPNSSASLPLLLHSRRDACPGENSFLEKDRQEKDHLGAVVGDGVSACSICSANAA